MTFPTVGKEPTRPGFVAGTHGSERIRTSSDDLWAWAIGVLKQNPPLDAWRILADSLPGRPGTLAKKLTKEQRQIAFLAKRRVLQPRKRITVPCPCGFSYPHTSRQANQRHQNWRWWSKAIRAFWDKTSPERRREIMAPVTQARIQAKAQRLVDRLIPPKLQAILGPEESLRRARLTRPHRKVLTK